MPGRHLKQPLAHNECSQGFYSTMSATWRGDGRAEPGWQEEQGQPGACQELSLQRPGRKVASQPAELGRLWQCRGNGACGVGRITRHNLSQFGRLGTHWPSHRAPPNPPLPAFHFLQVPPTYFLSQECQAHHSTSPVSSFNWLARSTLHAHFADSETEAQRQGGM